jgi:hypothetical protein
MLLALRYLVFYIKMMFHDSVFKHIWNIQPWNFKEEWTTIRTPRMLNKKVFGKPHIIFGFSIKEMPLCHRKQFNFGTHSFTLIIIRVHYIKKIGGCQEPPTSLPLSLLT